VPVSDTLKIRAAFNAVRRDGYLTDGRNDDDRRAGRVTIDFEPSPDLSFLLIGDIQRVRGKGPGGVVNPLPAAATTAFSGPSDPAVLAQLRAFSAIALLPDATAAFLDGDFQNLTAEVTGNLGFATLTALGGYRHATTRSRTAQPGFDSLQNERSSQYSFETRLSNESDNFKWVVGALYFQIDQSQDTTVLLNNAAPFGRNRILYPKLPTKSYGIFGEATYSVTPELRLIAGARYSDEKKEVSGSNNDLVTNRPPLLIAGSQTFSKVTYKAGVEYDVGPKNMVYATVSTGFKAGGFSPVLPPNLEFGPETLTSFIVGSRNRFLDDRLQLNVEGFYWKYDDYQVGILGPQPNGINGVATFNAGAATIYGLDVDLVAKITRNDTIRFVGEYLHTNFDSFVFDRATAGIAAATACPIVGPVRAVVGGNVQSIDCSGFPLTRSPKWTGAGSYQHIFPLANGGNVDFKTNFSFTSSRFLSVEYTAPTRAKAYATVDADLAYNAPDKAFSITAYVRNITNKAYFTGGTFQPLSGSRLFYQTIGSPRTYGLRMTVNF
jgi:iron complex outermembrane recepter protein